MDDRLQMSGTPLPPFEGVLTAEHETLVAGIRDQWMRDGLSTRPVDRGEAERAVREMYALVGLEPPLLKVWVDSPPGCFPMVSALGGSIVRCGHFENRLKECLEGRLRDRLGQRLLDRLRCQLRARLWEPLWGQLRAQLRGQLLSQLGDRAGSDPSRYVWGAKDIWRDAYWIAFYTSALRVAGAGSDERLDALAEVTRRLGWWIPLAGAVVMSGRPVAIRRDGDLRLHCENGPALSWPDGHTLYAWHGTRVPKWVIEAPNCEAIAAEKDAEVRRCAIESLGWDRYVAETGLPLVASAEDPRDPALTLALYEVPEEVLGEPARVLLRVGDPTGPGGSRGRAGLVVPVETATPLEASEWDHPRLS
ncbi:DUF6745 domain-containing protein [Streptosporangium sp. NPDC000239]|uniref:DUF6745 domain-containing protein n=1 Tax=Streptosporangium sp. NPDC000239 TaxID=3154248 RepID=UPI00331905E2